MIWIGGILFFSIILLPSVQQKLSPEVGGPFLRDIYLKFQKFVATFVVLLLITGGINVHFSGLTKGEFTTKYIWVLITKILFFTVLVTLYVLNLKNLSTVRKKNALHKIPFQDASFVLGVLIVLMAAFLKHTP